MNGKQTIIVVGGGYGGINLINKLKKVFKERLNKDINIILVDKNAYHFKKVKLFKAIVEEDVTCLKVPLIDYCGPGVQFVQGELTAIDQDNLVIEIINNKNENIQLSYTTLVLALGSVPIVVDAAYGGRSLTRIEEAKLIRMEILKELQLGKNELRIVVAGGGITGIETSAEITSWLKKELLFGKELPEIEVLLINDKDKLLPDVPEKVSSRLENRLNKLGIKTYLGVRVESFNGGFVKLSNGRKEKADYCIWTLGLKPNPCLETLGLPLHDNGKLKTDHFYRVENSHNIFAIGDCVHVMDPLSGAPASMSCKEAINQAVRLAKIIEGDIKGELTEGHKAYPNLYCITLGPRSGFVWTHQWGVNFIISGKVASKIRDYTWNMASLFK